MKPCAYAPVQVVVGYFHDEDAATHACDRAHMRIYDTNIDFQSKPRPLPHLRLRRSRSC